ncbi:MAG: PqqD family protein [Allosphingosinicella sp.]
MSQSERCYRLAPKILSVPVDSEAILLSIESGRYYGIKGAMGYLLEDLRDGICLDEMISRTCSRFAVSTADAARDLEDMLPRLIEAGIIEPVPG